MSLALLLGPLAACACAPLIAVPLASPTPPASLSRNAGSPTAPAPVQVASSPSLGAATIASAPSGSSALIDLAVPGHRPALLSVPLDTGSPRPLLVATHGAGGRPDDACNRFRALVGARAFVLCPRGVSVDVFAERGAAGFFYPTHHALAREVSAALAALIATFGERVDTRAPVYAGFSQGAVMGALAFVTTSAPFPRMLLVEGGVGERDEWTLAGAQAFHDAGGARVLLVCGRASCFEAAKHTERLLERAGIEARARFGPGGHTEDGPVGEVVQKELPWLLEGDARW